MEKEQKPWHDAIGPKQKKPRHTWAWIYGTLLTSYTAFTLLQVFVIPHDTVKMDTTAIASVYRTGDLTEISYGDQSSAEGSSDDADTGILSSLQGSNETDTGNISSPEESTDAASGSEMEPEIIRDSDRIIYRDGNMTITLTESYQYDTMIYVADIQLNSVALLKSGLAEDCFGRNVTEATSAIASRVGAILAVNGDFYGFRDTGYVIRNGILYRSTKKSNDAEDLVLWPDGTMEVIREGDVTAEELLEQGALQVYSFGPGLVQDGEITVDSSSEVGQAKTSNPRTAIGMISPLHYVMVVSDGRTSASAGLSLLQLAGIMKELGCREAYNLDGGGSTTMYFNGEVVNNPTSGGKRTKERSVSDIVYIGY